MTSGIEESTLFTVLWWGVAAMVVIAAFLVVHLTDLLKAALTLIASFLGIAGLFVMLNAEFLAVVQVLIYVGAISILFIFAIMLTQNVRQGNLPNRLQIPAVLFSVLLLAALVVVATSTEWNLIPAG